MNHAKETVCIVVLLLVLMGMAYYGTAVEAAAPTPPPAGTAVQLQTYGVLPVMVLNLTQSPINYNISMSPVSSVYTTGASPVAIGLHGWSFIAGGNSTLFFNNPTTPNTVPPQPTNSNQRLFGACGNTDGRNRLYRSRF